MIVHVPYHYFAVSNAAMVTSEIFILFTFPGISELLVYEGQWPASLSGRVLPSPPPHPYLWGREAERERMREGGRRERRREGKTRDGKE